jgi:hypothetical protein
LLFIYPDLRWGLFNSSFLERTKLFAFIGLSITLIGLLITVSINTFRRLFPAKEIKLPSGLSFEELKNRYNKWFIASVALTLIFTSLLSYVWYLILPTAVDFFFPPPSGAFSVLGPKRTDWILSALCLGYVCSTLLKTLLYKGLSKDRFTEYEVFRGLKKGRDTGMILNSFILVVGIMLIVVYLNLITVFDEQGISTQRFWGGRGVHPYSKVTSIRKENYIITMYDKRIWRPHYVIEFTNGWQWSTLEGFHNQTPMEETKIIQFVSKKSGRPIEMPGNSSR